MFIVSDIFWRFPMLPLRNQSHPVGHTRAPRWGGSNVEDRPVVLGGSRHDDYLEDLSLWYVVVEENMTEVGIGGGCGVVD